MDRFSSSSADNARRKRIYIGIAVGVVLVILVIGLSIGLSKRKKDNPSPSPSPSTNTSTSTSTSPSTNPSPSPTPHPNCEPVKEDVKRFDCHSDRPISQESCLNRGCCFVPASDISVKDYDLINSSYLGVPSCFFPVNYTGYELKSKEKDGSTLRVFLKRVTPSGFPKDVEEVILEVTPIDDNRLRIQIQDSKKSRFKPDVPVLRFKIEDHRDEKYDVDVGTHNGSLRVTRKRTGTIVFQTELTNLIFSDQFIQLSTLLPSKYIFGLSEQKEGILKSTNWTRYTLFNQGDLPVPHRNLYGSHPFYIVKEPRQHATGVFLLNTNAIDYFLQPTPAVTIRAVGGILDFFLFLGPTPADVVAQYTGLFGRPNFPPRWSLGFQLCKYGYFSLVKTKEILDRNLAVDIPVDVQWHDIDYMNRYLDFTYDKENFAGLPEFVEGLHDQGRRYIAMISPGVSNTEKRKTYAPYDEGERLDLFIKDTNGSSYIEGKVWNVNYTVFPDFSNPSTPDYWKSRFIEFHKELKFDGVWIDMNEPLNFLNGSSVGCPDTPYDNPPYLPGRPYPLNTLTLCMSARHNKTVHYNEHNLVAYREAEATHKAMVNITKKRPFIISRASFSGQGVYSGHWSGDITSNWDDMRYTIPAMLAFSLYGMPMTGSDICGFRLNTTEELCARWQALGAFYPMSRNHNDYDTIEQDPANMGKDVIEATKKALKIRYYLLPYLYTTFYRNHAFGETVARPLFFEFPSDENTYDIEDQFLLGPALHIMPALEPGITKINPYIPEGLWYDYHTGEKLVGDGKRKEMGAPLTHINVAIRGGYILPAQKPGKTVKESLKSPYDLLVALDDQEKAAGELFLDDGESIDTYKNGAYILINMYAEKNVLNTTVAKNGESANMDLGLIRVYGLSESSSFNVTINGKPANHTFVNNELQINGTSFSLLTALNVRWN